jgi:hypothetical protein
MTIEGHLIVGTGLAVYDLYAQGASLLHFVCGSTLSNLVMCFCVLKYLQVEK